MTGTTASGKVTGDGLKNYAKSSIIGLHRRNPLIPMPFSIHVSYELCTKASSPPKWKNKNEWKRTQVKTKEYPIYNLQNGQLNNRANSDFMKKLDQSTKTAFDAIGCP